MVLRRVLGWRSSAIATASVLILLSLPVPLAGQALPDKGASKAALNAAPAGSRLQAQRPAAVLAPEMKRPSTEVRPAPSLAAQYCQAVLEPAREARYAHQVAELKELGRGLDERFAKIESRIAELKEWVARRDDFVSRTNDQLVTIYSSMRPEAASEQLTRLDEISAAAIISKLAPRAASQILNDMPSEKAARLATILMGASRKPDPGARP